MKYHWIYWVGHSTLLKNKKSKQLKDFAIAKCFRFYGVNLYCCRNEINKSLILLEKALRLNLRYHVHKFLLLDLSDHNQDNFIMEL